MPYDFYFLIEEDGVWTAIFHGPWGRPIFSELNFISLVSAHEVVNYFYIGKTELTVNNFFIVFEANTRILIWRI